MDLVTLDVPGARQPVELENPQGVFYKLRIGGEVVKRKRSVWHVPLRNGSTNNQVYRLDSRASIPLP